MLEGLGTVAWGDLEHAYGAASNIPDRLRAIVATRGTTQVVAIDEFCNDICHQGSAYSATAPCVPFICEIIGSPRMARRHELVSLLLTIAIGLDDDMLSDGARITEHEAKQRREVANWPKSKKRPTSWGPFVWLDCYHTVECIVPQLVMLLDDRRRRVRHNVQYLLAWFPRQRRHALPQLRSMLKDATRWDDLANATLCVGLLEWQSAVRKTSWRFVLPLLTHRREDVRYAAAIYLSWHRPTDAVRNILRELSTREDYDGNSPLPFNGYSWTGFACQQLTRVWGENAEMC